MKAKRNLFLLFFLFAQLAGIAQDKINSIQVAADSQFTRHGPFFKFLFGKNYRRVWARPVTAHVFTLNYRSHQFTPVRTGGGLQTKSLHLTDEADKEWVLRSVQKNPSSWLGPFWRKTFINKIVQDQISASHPYGCLVVPDLADALQVDHNNPELVIVQDDSRLGKFRDTFANRLCFLEERNPKGKTISTEKLFALKDSLPGILIDSITYLKCRLLDIVIGDWDRHPDQYRWYSVVQDGTKLFKPVPNDRDQVFFSTHGLVPGLILRLGFMKYLEGFNADVRNVNRFMQRGHSLDKKILQNFDDTAWKQVTNEVVNNLTDTVLQQALSKLPEELHPYNKSMLEKMISRRDELAALSNQYYKKLVNK